MRFSLLVATCLGTVLAARLLWAQGPAPTAPVPPGPATWEPPSPTLVLPGQDGAGNAGEGRLAPEGALTLAELEQMALECNPTLAQAAARVQAARGQWVQAGLCPNPSLGYSAEEMGDEGTAGKQGAMFGQEFVTAGKLRLNRAVASQEIARAERAFAAQELRVLTDVRLNYYRVLVAQQRLELTQQLIGIAQEGVNTAEALLKAQEASRVDLLQTRVQANTTRILLVNAQAALQAARETLAAVVGMPELPPRPLAGEVEVGAPVPWKGALERLLTRSPEMAVAMAELERARWAVQRAYAGRIPNIETVATLHKDNASGDTVAGVEAGVALPIFDRNQGNIVRTQALVTEARRNVDRVRFSLQSRLAEAFRRYESARNQVQQYREQILPDAKASLDLVRTGYQAGEFDYLGLLTAQQTYFQSNLAYLDALVQLKSAESLIEGMLLSGSLQAQDLPAPPEAETLTPGVQNQNDFITELSPSP